MRIPPTIRLAVCLSPFAVAMAATPARGAGVETLRHAWVSIQCRSAGAPASAGCTYFSEVMPVASLGGSGDALTDGEKDRLRRRALDRFDTLGQPCPSKLANVSLAYPSRVEAEAQRVRFMRNSRTACRQSFAPEP